jgi:hypothetical protein
MEAIIDEADPVDPRFNAAFLVGDAVPADTARAPSTPEVSRIPISTSHAAVPTSAAAAAASTRREVRRDLSHRPRSTTSTLATTVPSPATTWKARNAPGGSVEVRSGLGDGTTVRGRLPLRTRHGAIREEGHVSRMRVVIAEDQFVMSEGVWELLEGTGSAEVVARC